MRCCHFLLVMGQYNSTTYTAVCDFNDNIFDKDCLCTWWKNIFTFSAMLLMIQSSPHNLFYVKEVTGRY